jgi:hypothetical protein
MGSYDSLGDILDVLGKRFSLLLEQDDTRLLIGLPHLLAFLREEALLSTATTALQSETDKREQAFGLHDRRSRDELAQLWPRCEAIAKTIIVKAGQEDLFRSYGSIEDVDRRLKVSEAPRFPTWGELTNDGSEAGGLLRLFDHWLTWKRNALAAEQTLDALDVLETELEEIRQRHEHQFRRFWLDGRNLAGVALRRLDAWSSSLNPGPTNPTDVEGTAARWASISMTRNLVEGIFESSYFLTEEQSRDLREAGTAVRRDLRLVHHEIRSVLLLRRSHLGLLRRFGARCERYEVDELRKLFAVPAGKRDVSRSRSSGKNRARQSGPERRLVNQFAKFLFDQGLNPLVDAPVARLKPDILEMGAAIYVEAKQYGLEPQGKSSRDVLRKAFGQVFDTWARLRATVPLQEAFLVVFRLGGSLVLLPDVVSVDGRTLYTWTVDLAPAEQAGSRQRHRPIEVTQAEVVEWSTSR